MAIRANQRQVSMSEEYVRSRFRDSIEGRKAFEEGDKIVGVSLQHSLDDKVPNLIIFLVEKPDDQG